MKTRQFLPLREIRPAGWIQEFLRTQAAGMTGHPEVHGYPYGQAFWGSNNTDTGPYDTWWPYEQTGYWLDGALKCGYLCGDAALYRRALGEVEQALEKAAPDGFIGPPSTRERDRWPHAVFFRAVMAQYEITGDRRYLDAMARHYRALPHPMNWDRDVTGVEALVYLSRQTGAADFLAMAEDLYARFNTLAPEHDCAVETMLSDKKVSVHGVTFNEISKLAAILSMANGNSRFLEAAVHAFAKADRDQLLADGLHSCTEGLRGRDSLDSHETCDITDHTWALGYLLQATGAVKYADRIEKVIFNALPGAVTKDFTALQYFSCPNQVIATHTSNHNLFLRGFNWMSYRPDHEVQCCPGNVHRAMPNFVSRQWLKCGADELIAALYGPGQVETVLGGQRVRVEAVTNYPAAESVEFIVTPQAPARFTISLRIPGWCRRARLLLNGAPIDLPLEAGSFQPVEREWMPGDRIRLELPFELALERFPGGGVSVDYGPLTMSLPVAANAGVERGDSTNAQRRDIHGKFYTPRQRGATDAFPAWELTPAGPWNYALCVDESSIAQAARVRWDSRAGSLFDPGSPFVRLYLPARKVEGWDLVEQRTAAQEANWVSRGKWRHGIRRIQGPFLFTPRLPARKILSRRLIGETEWIELVPYGTTLLRLTVFPQGPVEEEKR